MKNWLIVLICSALPIFAAQPTFPRLNGVPVAPSNAPVINLPTLKGTVTGDGFIIDTDGVYQFGSGGTKIDNAPSGSADDGNFAVKSNDGTVQFYINGGDLGATNGTGTFTSLGLITRNFQKASWVYQGSSTNQSFDVSKTNVIVIAPTNTTTAVFANAPSAGSDFQRVQIAVIWTNMPSGATFIHPAEVVFPFGAPPLFNNSTNFFTYEYWGTNWYGFGAQSFPSSFYTSVIAGTGGALTNITFESTIGDRVVNGFTNVFITSITGTAVGRADFWTVTITNLSGSDRTFGVSQVVNAWRWTGVYGSNMPSVLTNGTALMLAGRSEGTNTKVGYSYTSAP